MYGKTIEYIKDIRSNPKLNRKVKEFLIKKDLAFSYDRYFWHKKKSQGKHYHYDEDE